MRKMIPLKFIIELATIALVLKMLVNSKKNKSKIYRKIPLKTKRILKKKMLEFQNLL